VIQRESQILALLRYFRRFPVVALLGARQTGKSSVARVLADRFDGPSRFYDLRKITDRYRLTVPEQELNCAKGLLVIDEAHRLPRIFPSLPRIIDRIDPSARLLLIGGPTANLLQPCLEDLGDKIGILELPGLSLHEVGAQNFQRLWLRGGLPLSYTARTDDDSFKWRMQHTLDITDSDPSRPGPPVDPGPLRQFLLTIAQHHGKTLDVAEIARSFGVRNHTVERYLDILRESFVIRMLNPFRSGRTAGEQILPKVFFSDTGVLHNLTGLETLDALTNSPKAALSWKGYAMESTIRRVRAGASECHHWTLKGAQGIDLLVVRDGFRWGFEFQYLDRPRVTTSIRLAQRELKLNRVDVIHQSEGPGMLEGEIQVHTLESLPQSLRLPLGFERRPEFLEMERELTEVGI